MPFELRPIASSDVDAVAQLHASSWRSAYRGILSDAYLDGDLLGDRMAVWDRRLAQLSPQRYGFLALHDQEPIGFSFAFISDDKEWGTRLDNLHVLPSARGSGIGRALMGKIGHAALEHAPSKGVYLWVYEQNQTARGFYERLQAKPVERVVVAAPDGKQIPEWRYVWNDPALLLKALDCSGDG